MLNVFICRLIDDLIIDYCKNENVFNEWTDRILIKSWIKILSSIKTLTEKERRQMQNEAIYQGIYRIYRQTLLFPTIVDVNHFRLQLEYQYGNDVHLRKGNEIIFTTKQLLNDSPLCHQAFSVENNNSIAHQF